MSELTETQEAAVAALLEIIDDEWLIGEAWDTTYWFDYLHCLLEASESTEWKKVEDAK